MNWTSKKRRLSKHFKCQGDSDVPALPRWFNLQPLEPRYLMSGVAGFDTVAEGVAAQTVVSSVVEHDNVGYVLVKNDPRVERYDITAEAWLSPILLAAATGPATALYVDDDGIFIAYEKSIYRYNMDGSGVTYLTDANYNVLTMHSDGDILFVNSSTSSAARLISISKPTNQVIDTFNNWSFPLFGSSIATAANRIIGRSGGVSPADINYMNYADDGTFIGGADSQYHGDFATASRTWAFPDGAKVVDNSGTIYLAEGRMTWLKSFDSRIDDIDFLSGDRPIVLNGNTLTAYSSEILPEGSYSLDYSPAEIFANDTHVITFTKDLLSPTGFQVDLVPLALLTPPAPNQVIDPIGLAYTPDQVELASDGTVLLFSKAHQSVFRWDPVWQSYGQTIPLIGSADYMAYSSATNSIYLAYSSGLIRQINLDDPHLVEEPFAILPESPLGLAAAGPYLFAVDPAGAWASHYTYDVNGTLVDLVDWNYYSQEYIWSEANQKMYFLRDDTTPNDLLWEEINADAVTYPSEPPGGIGAKVDSPLHSSSGFSHPIRVAPDGSVVVLGSGMIHDATTLERLTLSLTNSIKDAAWLGNELYTIHGTTGGAEVQQWNSSTYELNGSVQVSGAAHALKALVGNRLLLVTISGAGIPEFTVLNENLDAVLAGDLNGDGFVGIADLNQILVMWNQTLPVGNPLADPSGDGFVGIEDLNLVLGNWNAGTPPLAMAIATSVSEQAVTAQVTFAESITTSESGQQSQRRQRGHEHINTAAKAIDTDNRAAIAAWSIQNRRVARDAGAGYVPWSLRQQEKSVGLGLWDE